MQGHYCSMPVCESSILSCNALCFYSIGKTMGIKGNGQQPYYVDICFSKCPTGPSFPHPSTYHVSENGPHHPHKVAEVTERVQCRGYIGPL